ncbi:MAG: 3-methyl-2-oxobutanoate hydroxymethyltransferase [Deltaproteobacteria bacterium]|nr:3-methyl-2-oxobutanoate hydroxymethyltransferase [Deltaproteobacteria bacterium]
MRTSLNALREMKGKTPISALTAYDATQAALLDGRVDMLLVGDSLSMVIQGNDSTLPVTLDEMVYHTRLVARGSRKSFLVADMPFLSYQPSVEDAVRGAGRLLKEGGAQMVKLEGGTPVAAQVRALAGFGIPVMGHLGLTPQHINALGGYGKQAKDELSADLLLKEAQVLADAGASMLLLENIPHDLAGRVSASLTIPTIGIGAGPRCDGQIQVFHDVFGLIPDFQPRHAVRYMEGGREIQEAAQRYAADVRGGKLFSP